MLANRLLKSEPDIARPQDEEVRACLQQLLCRIEFNASARNKRFLAYVVEETLSGRADRIKAYNIALAAFNRSEDFDPLIDPIVRIEARRLRTSLDHYYLTVGATDEIRIEMPKGSYVATFAYRYPVVSELANSDEPLPTPDVAQPPVTAKRRGWVLVASVLAVLAALVSGIAVYGLWNEGNRERAAASANAPTIVVLPFENTSGDPSRAFVARGLTFDLMVKLTQLKDVTVLSAYSGLGEANVDQALARSNYALFGSVQPEANTIRVIAILANSRTGQFLQSWSIERDFEQANYPDIQLDIAGQIVSAVMSICATRPGEGGSKTPLDPVSSFDCRHLPMSPPTKSDMRSRVRIAKAIVPNSACTTIEWIAG